MPIKVVQKLQLKTKSHPKPYKVMWMSKDIKVIMNKHYLVSFFIGQKQFDNVWYNISQWMHVMFCREIMTV